MKLIDQIHDGYVFKRRTRVLSSHLSALLPPNVTVLDVGCGDGTLAKLIHAHRPDVQICGIDVLVRRETHIPVTAFDGAIIPYAPGTFDAVMFVDVLHHTNDPVILLREATRVARRSIIIKDHNRDGFLAGPTLRFMDWVGNVRHGVALPYNYWPERRWTKAFAELALTPTVSKTRIGLYPWPANWAFERRLHFIVRLDKREHEAG